jgi:peroxiredoxin
MNMRPCLSVLLLASLAATAQAIDLGETAPELEPSGWVQGEPVKMGDAGGKTAFILFFWRTFETDSVERMKELSTFYEKHKAKGLEVVAVSTEPADEVKTYLADNKVAFRIALDQDHNIEGVYAKDVRKMPYAVVVDKTGVVVWKGDPAWGMNDIVERVLDGRFDLKKAQAIDKLQGDLWEFWWGSDEETDKLAKLADQILAIDPTHVYAYDARVHAFQRKKDALGFKKWVRAHVEKVKAEPKALSHVAWRLIGDATENGEWCDPELALTSVRKATDASKSADGDILDTHAHVLHAIGLLEQAIEIEKKALALAPENERYKGRLAFFQACLAAKAAASKR